MAVNIHGRIDSHVAMDIDNWTCQMRSQPDHDKSYKSGSQPPSIGNVRQMVVSEPSDSYQMYSDGQLPSVNDVCRREPSQSEASCNCYEGRDEQEVQQVISELNDVVNKKAAAGRSNDITAYSSYGEPTQDLVLRLGSKNSQSFAVPAQELVSELRSTVYTPFKVPDETRFYILNSFDVAKYKSSLFNGGVLVPPPQPFQPTPTYTKVYKTGTPEKSIDITAYSGYDELKEDLAMIFCMEGLLDDSLKTGWQLVFMDYENGVLLHGDDPWPEFVNHVHHINILSPQEVQ